MATTSTIGTAARNYSTVAAWLAAFTTGGWIGECYNDSEFTITAAIDFTGHATSAADFIRLTTAAGQSFQDHASVQTNAVIYNASNGVGIRKTNGYAQVINITEDYVTVSKLQLKDGGNSIGFNCSTGSLPNILVDSCIIETNSASGGTPPLALRSGRAVNCTLINLGSNGPGVTLGYPSGTPKIANCTIVRSTANAAAANGIDSSPGAYTVENCAIFGFSNTTGGGTPGGSNNASDTTISFGSSNQASKTFANQFVSTTNNFKAKTGADILDTGTDLSGSYSGTSLASSKDMVLTTRPQNAIWDIGAWELVVGGGGGATAFPTRSLMGVGR